MSEFNVVNVMDNLERKTFVSEADFQLEFGWTIRELYGHKYQVFMEYPMKLKQSDDSESVIHVDILLVDRANDKWIPIELKYKTRKYKIIAGGHEFYLKDQGARDTGCYDYLKDIERIEHIANSDYYKQKISKGFTVFYTNDTVYKNGVRDGCSYQKFSLADLSECEKEMNWINEPSVSKQPQYCNPIKLKKPYSFHWKELMVGDDNIINSSFFYLFNEVTREKED